MLQSNTSRKSMRSNMNCIGSRKGEVKCHVKNQKKQKNGEGSFRLKPSGLIEYRFTYKDEFGQNRQTSYSCPTRQECIDKAEEFLTGQAKLAAGLDINATIVDILKKKYEYDYKKNYLSEAGYSLLSLALCIASELWQSNLN